VVVIGGLGSLRGAILGSLLVGLIYDFGQSLVPDLAYFVVFAPMALVLLLRPQGLFGRAG
jgi:branched-chain amino acid transport system permease protein